MASREQDLQAQLDKLNAENKALKAGGKTVHGFSLKVSEKGAVSIYGLGRFPITLYKEQLRKLLAGGPELEAFMVANDKALRNKDDPKPTPVAAPAAAPLTVVRNDPNGKQAIVDGLQTQLGVAIAKGDSAAIQALATALAKAQAA